MAAARYPSARSQAERTIAVARVVLAASSLFAIWLDPAEPTRHEQVTYTLHAIYVAYALTLLAAIWPYPTGRWLPLITHATDIVVFSGFQYLTLGPSSPFFVYFIFSVFCAAVRWGWRGTLATASVVLVAYVAMSVSMSRTLGPTEFELNRIVVRAMYLVVSTSLLVYLGLYEERLRREMQRLARWPAATGTDIDRALERALEHAAQILGAGVAAVVWDAGEEPAVHLTSWLRGGSRVTKHRPDDLYPLLPPHLEEATFLCTGTVAHDSTAMVGDGKGGLSPAGPLTLRAPVLEWLRGQGLASAVFRTERVAGRVFFTDIVAPTAETLPLTEVLAREIGATLDQVHVTQQATDIAAGEERIRLARDLHDGVLQSLTGIRLEIRALATSVDDSASEIRDRLFALERALAIEQRELRLFIGGLKPAPDGAGSDTTLRSRLQALRERIALEWKAPVTIHVAQEPSAVSDQVGRAVPLMVHEAVVNALKHAHPSGVAVTVDVGGDDLRIVVSDDGLGFPFRGLYDHAKLTESNAGPRSLLARVTSLGGRMSIESTDAGSRVELLLPLERGA